MNFDASLAGEPTTGSTERASATGPSVVQIVLAMLCFILDSGLRVGRRLQTVRACLSASRKSVRYRSAQDFGLHTQLVSMARNKSMLFMRQIVKPVVLRIMWRDRVPLTNEGGTCLDREARCPIPDVCIDERRLPLFIARATLRELIAGLEVRATGEAAR